MGLGVSYCRPDAKSNPAGETGENALSIPPNPFLVYQCRVLHITI